MVRRLQMRTSGCLFDRSNGTKGKGVTNDGTALYPLLVLLVILEVHDVLRIQTVPTPRPPGDTGCTRRT